MNLAELLVLFIGLPLVGFVAWFVDRNKKKDSSDFFTLDDDDF